MKWICCTWVYWYYWTYWHPLYPMFVFVFDLQEMSDWFHDREGRSGRENIVVVWIHKLFTAQLITFYGNLNLTPPSRATWYKYCYEGKKNIFIIWDVFVHWVCIYNLCSLHKKCKFWKKLYVHSNYISLNKESISIVPGHHVSLCVWKAKFWSHKLRHFLMVMKVLWSS